MSLLGLNKKLLWVSLNLIKCCLETWTLVDKTDGSVKCYVNFDKHGHQSTHFFFVSTSVLYSRRSLLHINSLHCNMAFLGMKNFFLNFAIAESQEKISELSGHTERVIL
jgi:hypothetical protein